MKTNAFSRWLLLGASIASIEFLTSSCGKLTKVSSLEQNIAKITEYDTTSSSPKVRQRWIDSLAYTESTNGKRKVREVSETDSSYGLYQFTIGTARGLEERYPDLPRLGSTEPEIIKSLLDDKISTEYMKIAYDEAFQVLKDNLLVIAAHNVGIDALIYARTQQRLNDLLGTNLICDGDPKELTKKAVMEFQKWYNSKYPNDKIKADGILGPETDSKLAQEWVKQSKETGYRPKKVLGQTNAHFLDILANHPEKVYDPIARIPNNRGTPVHVAKTMGEYARLKMQQQTHYNNK